MSDAAPIGVVTVSDRASAGLYEDKGGPGIEAALHALLAGPWRPVRALVPDSASDISAARGWRPTRNSARRFARRDEKLLRKCA